MAADGWQPRRHRPGLGWLALIGGGEFTFGETLDADLAWLDKTKEGPIAFVPAASGSVDYGRNLEDYFREAAAREVELVPIYRRRDARRQKNVKRLESAPAVYLGGGVSDLLLETLEGTPALEALERRLEEGGTVVAIAAAAQATGSVVRDLRGRDMLRGLGWLEGGVVETNFEPGHDRRLRQLVEREGVSWGLGLPAGSSVLLGPDDRVEYVGTVFGLRSLGDELEVLHDDLDEFAG